MSWVFLSGLRNNLRQNRMLNKLLRRIRTYVAYDLHTDLQNIRLMTMKNPVSCDIELESSVIADKPRDAWAVLCGFCTTAYSFYLFSIS